MSYRSDFLDLEEARMDFCVSSLTSIKCNIFGDLRHI